jgi:hypothetical protein
MYLASKFHIIENRKNIVARDSRARRLWRLVLQAQLRAKRYHGDMYLPEPFRRFVPVHISRHAARLDRLARQRYAAFIAYCDSI